MQHLKVYLHEKNVFKKFPTQLVHGDVALSVCPTI